MYGALVEEKMKSGMLTGKCVTSVDGVKSIQWVQQQAEEFGLTQARICRNLLNEMIQLKMKQSPEISG